MSDCIFCRMAAGQLSADLVWQDEQTLAFRDINPQAPTHILIIPRVHISSLQETEDGDTQVLGLLLRTARQVAQQESVESGYRLVLNNGAPAGQSVFHIHLHLLAGRVFTWPPG